ncbi:hypothetical protein BO82DRAFT_417518 [Aspergillus uvarum CBS 121591]|uniref:Uncharacterized protein n=1 Tax=Aspergillus uvarum CBS 121591 TaxID=1448315 RepID=A0A319CP28_9EURO|nr:hypothetical protein BO82DRAFT_417518 [Aspergillus uvarum CBS 121591]PYH80503.1 hypothetical protein BO82DRAFT_417518 [Aspergillus uvarum CBS 121591]
MKHILASGRQRERHFLKLQLFTPITEPHHRFNLRKALLLVERDIKALEEQDIHTLDQNVLKRDMPEPTPEYVDREDDTDSLTLCTLCLDLITHPFRVTRIGDYNIRNLYRMVDPEYGALSIVHVAKASKPHMKCIMHNDLNVDDSHLLYGDILTVIRILDMVALAYFDGQELLICRTKPYDFTFLSIAGFKILAQWFLGDHIGITSREAVRT